MTYLTEGLPTNHVTTGEVQVRLVYPSKFVQRRPHRLSVEEKLIVRDKAHELLKAGIIRPSCSPFSSPALLVKKKDGQDRMCIDYRELNDNTVSDKFPIPLVDDQIARLGWTTWFTCLDMLSGYHQIICASRFH